MRKPKPIKKTKKDIVVSKLIPFIADNLPNFIKSLHYDKTIIGRMGENRLTARLVSFLDNKSRIKNLNFSFMHQAPQNGGRMVDIGVGLLGNRLNYIFCIEAKFLPHSPFDYVTGKYAGIKRFKAMEHGLNNDVDKIPLPQNGIVAYIKSGTFEKHIIKINQKIQKIANNHSQKPDVFGLTWDDSEQLEKNNFNSIGKLFSKHPRQKASDVSLYHFWIYVH